MCQHTISTYTCRHSHYTTLKCPPYAAALSHYERTRNANNIRSSSPPVCHYGRQDTKHRNRICPTCEDARYNAPVQALPPLATRRMAGQGLGGTMSSRQQPPRHLPERRMAGLGTSTMSSTDRAQQPPTPLRERGQQNRRRDRPTLDRGLTSQRSARLPVSVPSQSKYNNGSKTPTWNATAERVQRNHADAYGYARRLQPNSHGRSQARPQPPKREEKSYFEISSDEDEEVGLRKTLTARASAVRHNLGNSGGKPQEKRSTRSGRKEKMGRKKKWSDCAVM